MPGGNLNISDQDREALLRRVHSGEVDVFKLPVELYSSIAAEFSEAVFSGYGLNFDKISINTPDFQALQSLQRNVYVFSAAKTFQQIKDVQKFILDGKGFIRPFRKFEEDAAKIFDTYNKQWLKAEYETAKEGARAARRWTEIQNTKHIFPFLKYQTREDSRVRPEHADLNGIIRPVDDSFWDTHTPPNGWGCNNRCRLVKLRDADELSPLEDQGGGSFLRPDTLDGDGKPLKTNPLPKLFNFNYGKEGLIFPDRSIGKGIDSHPYFTVANRFDTHKNNNFNLPLPKRLVQPVTKIKVKGQAKRPTPAVRLKDALNKIKQITPINDRIGPLEKQGDILLQERNALVGKINAAIRARDTPTEVKLRPEYELKNAAYNKNLAAIRKERRAYEDEVTNALAQDTRATFTDLPTDGIKRVTRYRAGVDAFKRLVGDRFGIEGRKVTAAISRKKHQRAYQSGNGVWYGRTDGVDTIAHELGHWLETFDKNYFNKVKDFYARRTKGLQPTRLKDLFPGAGYRANEITIEDKFTSPYTGKQYFHPFSGAQVATEVTPMWFTEVYRDIHTFIAKDRDHFETIFKLLNE